VSDIEVGDLIKVVDPAWTWIDKGDVGIIIKKKLWEDSYVTPLSMRYIYRVRFARSNVTRFLNRREFEVVRKC
jgi:hypothetical protein